MSKNDAISRRYAIAQIEIAITEADTDAEKETFQRFKEFLSVLPCIEEPEQSVYRSGCDNRG